MIFAAKNNVARLLPPRGYKPEFRSCFGNLGLNSGYANLPIGGLQVAIQENGLPEIINKHNSIQVHIVKPENPTGHLSWRVDYLHSELR
jgi:hypothetical protein